MPSPILLAMEPASSSRHRHLACFRPKPINIETPFPPTLTHALTLALALNLVFLLIKKQD
jgi:hypothetical protein